MKKSVVIIFVLTVISLSMNAQFLLGAYGKLLNNKIELDFINLNFFTSTYDKAVASFENGFVIIKVGSKSQDKHLIFTFYDYKKNEVQSSYGSSMYKFTQSSCGYNKSPELKMSLGTMTDIWHFRSNQNEDIQISILNNAYIYFQFWKNKELRASSLIKYTPENWERVISILKKFTSN